MLETRSVYEMSVVICERVMHTAAKADTNQHRDTVVLVVVVVVVVVMLYAFYTQAPTRLMRIVSRISLFVPRTQRIKRACTINNHAFKSTK